MKLLVSHLFKFTLHSLSWVRSIEIGTWPNVELFRAILLLLTICRETLYKVWAAPFWCQRFSLLLAFPRLPSTWLVGTIFNVFGITQILTKVIHINILKWLWNGSLLIIVYSVTLQKQIKKQLLAEIKVGLISRKLYKYKYVEEY